MTEKEKIIEKLKKLFALGTSPNHHEAEAALAKAAAIMTEHNISTADVDLSEQGGITEERMPAKGQEKTTWAFALADACGMLYGCQTLRMRCAAQTQLRWVGTPLDVAAARMTFSHLMGSWRSIVKVDFGNRNEIALTMEKFKRSHLRGFYIAIARRVLSLVAKQKEVVHSATGRDLLVIKNAAINDFLSAEKIEEMRTRRTEVNREAFSAGLARGADIALHGAVEKNDGLKMIGSSL